MVLGSGFFHSIPVCWVSHHDNFSLSPCSMHLQRRSALIPLANSLLCIAQRILLKFKPSIAMKEMSLWYLSSVDKCWGSWRVLECLVLQKPLIYVEVFNTRFVHLFLLPHFHLVWFLSHSCHLSMYCSSQLAFACLVC